MITVRTVADLRAALRERRRAGETIGLVPTMGALHEGHLALIRTAREQSDVVVVSLFVNPAQFDDQGDLAAYPRDEERDARQAAEAGADVLFAPPLEEVYPPGFATSVQVTGALTETLEGARRGPQHFHGVATVVTKLFNMAQPDVAFFGAKDAQQALVVRRLVRDLDIPVCIELVETVREPDGLALSSRNVHLHGADRERALALHDAIATATRALDEGERDAQAIATTARAAMARHDVEPEYLALVDPETLTPVERVERPALLAVAARVGTTRLIDNTTLTPNGRH